MYKKIRSFDVAREYPFGIGSGVGYCISSFFDLSKLSVSGLRLLPIIGMCKEEDFIVLNVANVAEKMGVKVDAIYRGIGDLLDLGVIARKGWDEYWINRNVIIKQL